MDVVAGRLVPPAGEVHDPLLVVPAELRPGRRRTRVRIRARFGRRGRRVLAPPEVVVRDPLGLARRAVRARMPADEILVLPRIEALQIPAGAGGTAIGVRGRAAAAAEIDLDGLRAHRPGTPASRIAWPVYSRTGELHERVLRADADARPLIVVDLRGAAREEDADAAVRAAASIAVHLGERGGCALLLPGERRPLAVEPGLRTWPVAHARLALAGTGDGPVLAGLGARRGALVWVSARAAGETPRGLLRAPGAARLLVVPGHVSRPAPGVHGRRLHRLRRGAPASPATHRAGGRRMSRTAVTERAAVRGALRSAWRCSGRCASSACSSGARCCRPTRAARRGR